MKNTRHARRTEAPARTAGRPRSPVLSLAVQYARADDSLPSRASLRRWALAALRHDAQVTVRLVEAAEGRALNREYRGRDYATNVLTFAYSETPPLAGDIVLCTSVIAREARQQGKEPTAHYAHLLVHGLLHLQGHDHEDDTDARVMETLESEIVTRLGYPDPYTVAPRRPARATSASNSNGRPAK